MTEHKYAQVLRWIADGERIQHNFRGEWRYCANCSLLLMIANGSADSPSTFRLAPATITINGVEIEAPFVPAPGQECWAFNMQGHVTAYLYSPGISQDLADNGNCWRTKEAALAAFQAVKSAFTSHKAND